MKLTAKLYLYLSWDRPEEEPRLALFAVEGMEKFGYIPLETREISVEVDEASLIEQKLRTLQATYDNHLDQQIAAFAASNRKLVEVFDTMKTFRNLPHSKGEQQ